MTKRDILALAGLARAELTDTDEVEIDQKATEIVVRAENPPRTWYVSDGKVKPAKGNPPPKHAPRVMTGGTKTRSPRGAARR